MDCAPPNKATMRDVDYHDRSVHSDDSDSGSSSSSKYCDSLFEQTVSDDSSFGTPPPSPNKTNLSLLSESPLPFIPPPPGAYTYPSGRTILRMPAPRFKAPARVRAHLFKSTANLTPGQTTQAQTPLDGNFASFLTSPGMVWVDKLPFVYSLCPLIHNKLALVRRPSGLGQTAFLVAAMLAYEYFTPRVFHDLFGTSPIRFLDPSTPQLKTVTLNLDMALAFDYSMTSNLRHRINQYMKSQLEIILLQVADTMQLSPRQVETYFAQDSRQTFANLIEVLRGSSVKMVILVEDLNWALIRSETPDDAFQAAFLLDLYLVRPLQDAFEQNCIAGGILLGRPVEDEPAWVRSAYKGDALFTPIACDITHDVRVRGAFGFSLPEVTSLAEELLENIDARLSFLGDVKASKPAYCREEYIEYSMNDVLSRLRQETGQPGLEEEEEDLYYYCDFVDEGGELDHNDDVEMEEVANLLGVRDHITA